MRTTPLSMQENDITDVGIGWDVYGEIDSDCG